MTDAPSPPHGAFQAVLAHLLVFAKSVVKFAAAGSLLRALSDHFGRYELQRSAKHCVFSCHPIESTVFVPTID
ncbi:hypothetical protein QRQ56_22490 [Bradyrhizobium sp. U531]|uniref:hypothetical protein n=1 Tax=Bradyrhizobium sp. U531 TaxID=3053458 RepID=UPI003F426B6C